MFRNFNGFLNTASRQTGFPLLATHSSIPRNIPFPAGSVLTAYFQLRVRKLDVFPLFSRRTVQIQRIPYNASNKHLRGWISEIFKYCVNCCVPRSWADNLKLAYRTKVVFPSFEIRGTILIMSTTSGQYLRIDVYDSTLSTREIKMYMIMPIPPQDYSLKFKAIK